MQPCPKCGCAHIGTDVIYAHGVAMFCQECGHRGPRAHIEPDIEDWFPRAETDARVQWNFAAIHGDLLKPTERTFVVSGTSIQGLLTEPT